MISFSGVYLDPIEPDVAAYVERTVSTRDVVEFTARTWPGKGMTWAPFDERPWPPRRIKLGSLLWPRDASRFAVFHALIPTATRDAIRVACLTGDSDAPRTLTFADGKRSLSVSMFMLPIRPVAFAGAPAGSQGCHLLSLVDARFFWEFVAANISVSSGTTWNQLYSAVSAAIGIALTVDAIPAAYLQPSDVFQTRYRSLPAILDAIALNCGQRIVAGFDGSFRAWNSDASRDADAANFADLSANNPTLAGGLFDLSTVADLDACLPGQVGIAFPKVDAHGVYTGDSVLYTQTLAGLALGEFGGASGFGGVKLHRDTAACTGPGDATLQALVKQAATDFYRYAAAKGDLKAIGPPVGFQPTGLDDLIEIEHGREFLATRIMRGPWDDHREELGHLGPHGAVTKDCACAPAGSSLVLCVERFLEEDGQPDLSGVGTDAPPDGYVIKWSAAQGKWIAAPP